MAHGYVLHVGDVEIALQNTCNTEHTLNVKIGDEIFCAEMTSDTVTERSLRTKFGDTVWTVCNSGACGGVSDWVMPEVPYAPIQLPSNCNWEQTNPNAYLLSDGNQYFDTGEIVNTYTDIDFKAQVINGHSAHLMGTMDTSCFYDFTINQNREAYFRAGTRTGSSTKTLTAAQSTQKIRYQTSTYSSAYKRLAITFENESASLNKNVGSYCTGTQTILIFRNNLLTAIPNDGGMKLYYVKTYNQSGTMTHHYQPVAAGTNICGETAATNAMWDSVTKKLYYPGGTGQMGYGVDP